MAVLVQAWEVVARRTAVEDKLPGGLPGWAALAPNRMVCSDRNLCRAGFMHGADAEAFLVELEAHGLVGERGGVYMEVAVVEHQTPWRHECPWLVLGKHAGVTAAWLAGADPDPLVVPVNYRPTWTLLNLSDEQSSRLKFLRRDGNVEVYLDPETGTELFRGRTTEDPPPPHELQQRFERLTQVIEPYLSLDGHPKRLGWLARRKLNKAVRALSALADTDTSQWHVWWYLGMARRAASQPDAAYDAFRRAYHGNPEHADVLREYSGQCLALGKGAEAVAIAERNCRLNPEDCGLRSNLALALMVAGDMARAQEEVTQARAMDPDDPITEALQTMITEVVEGTRTRPTTYP